MDYLLLQRMDKVRYIATIQCVFMSVNAVKLVSYAWLGQFSADNLGTSLVLAPLVPLGVPRHPAAEQDQPCMVLPHVAYLSVPDRTPAGLPR